jgi:predicted dehydrogenase
VATVRWGVLSTAGIGTRQVIPAMQRGRYSRVTAIASRDRARAKRVAAEQGIATAHASYDDLLADPDVDAVYIPLPNHLHVPWSIRALEAGKHVLCEKPIGLDAPEAETLARAAAERPHLKVMEAFMYRFHPQWQRARQLVAEDGAIGEVRAIHTWFAYFNNDPRNIRNQKDAGGGALMDIGCYGVSIARFVLGREPRRVAAVSDIDPQFGTDRLTSALMEFEGAVGSFTCATQLARHQRVDILGTEGRIEIELPVNALPDQPSRILLQRAPGPGAPGAPGTIDEIVFAPCNQYTLQGDAFSLAVLENAPVPTPLGDAAANMRVIDAVKTSAERGGRVDLEWTSGT